MTRPLRVSVNRKLPACAPALVLRIPALPDHSPLESGPAWNVWTTHPPLGGGRGDDEVGAVEADFGGTVEVVVLDGGDAVDVSGVDDAEVVADVVFLEADDAVGEAAWCDPPQATAMRNTVAIGINRCPGCAVPLMSLPPPGSIV
jgi:hypothetical protein